VEFIQLISELQVNLFELIGQYEYEAKLSGYLHTVVGQYVERHIEATMDRAPLLFQLRRNCYQVCSQVLYLRQRRL
jgi:hypothetical protein